MTMARSKATKRNGPVPVQEKIHPQALIEDVRAAAREGKPRQAEVFADFRRACAGRRLPWRCRSL